MKPGESDTISVYVDTAGKAGDIVKTVRVFTNDPANSTLTLVIKARIDTQAARKASP